MHDERHIIVGVHITDRVKHVDEIQHIFTTYGSLIKTRLGLHEPGAARGGANGLVLLELVGEPSQADEMIARLRLVAGVQVQEMVFDHP